MPPNGSMLVLQKSKKPALIRIPSLHCGRCFQSPARHFCPDSLRLRCPKVCKVAGVSARQQEISRMQWHPMAFVHRESPHCAALRGISARGRNAKSPCPAARASPSVQACLPGAGSHKGRPHYTIQRWTSNCEPCCLPAASTATSCWQLHAGVSVALERSQVLVVSLTGPWLHIRSCSNNVGSSHHLIPNKSTSSRFQADLDHSCEASVPNREGVAFLLSGYHSGGK